MRILIAEDELPLARALIKILEMNKYSADAVYNGEDALAYLEVGNYDACILDIMMPRMDGISVLRTLRSKGCRIPVILLTAKGEVEDKVMGLDSGANDYLSKPFDMRELLARLRAITRPHPAQGTKLSFANMTLDRATFELSTPFGSFRLANKEFQILELLMQHPGYLFSSSRLLENIWGYDTDADISVVWVYISYLRKKLAALQTTAQIKATRHLGYSLEMAP